MSSKRIVSSNKKKTKKTKKRLSKNKTKLGGAALVPNIIVFDTYNELEDDIQGHLTTGKQEKIFNLKERIDLEQLELNQTRIQNLNPFSHDEGKNDRNKRRRELKQQENDMFKDMKKKETIIKKHTQNIKNHMIKLERLTKLEIENINTLHKLENESYARYHGYGNSRNEHDRGGELTL
tara:strand:+ start:1017 stop:1553 length:537 start_codon:yes stop_codon:yes gene_type:complete